MKYPFQLLIPSETGGEDDLIILFNKDSDRANLFNLFVKELLRSQWNSKKNDWRDFVFQNVERVNTYSSRLFEANEKDVSGGHRGLANEGRLTDSSDILNRIGDFILEELSFILSEDVDSSKLVFNRDLDRFLNQIQYQERLDLWFGQSLQTSMLIKPDFTPVFSLLKEDSPSVHALLDEIGLIEQMSNDETCHERRNAIFSCQDSISHSD